MTNKQIKELVASIPANELNSVLAQLDKMQAIIDGKDQAYEMRDGMAVVA